MKTDPKVLQSFCRYWNAMDNGSWIVALKANSFRYEYWTMYIRYYAKAYNGGEDAIGLPHELLPKEQIGLVNLDDIPELTDIWVNSIKKQ